MATVIDRNGLQVHVGNSMNIRVANSVSSTDKVDFEKPDGIQLMFPVSSTLKKDIEQIEKSFIGLRQVRKFLGKTTITGDLSDVLTPNGVAWYLSKVYGGVFKSIDNDNALMSIEAEGGFIIDITRENNKTKKVEFVYSATETETIDITTDMKVSEVIASINSLPLKRLKASLHIGEGSEVFNIEGTDISLNCFTTVFLRCGILSESYKKELAPFISYMIPKSGAPSYFNMLTSSNKVPLNLQYIGVRTLSLNLNFANSNLSELTSSLWASDIENFSGNPKEEIVNDVKSAYAQTNGRTLAYICGILANSIASCVNNFQWGVEPDYNINNQSYEVPNEKNTDGYTFEMMYNKQARDIFETKVLNNENISVVLNTRAFADGKQYNLIKSAKSLLCKPAFPEIADGVLKLSVGDATAIDSVYDPFTSMFIITSDIKLDISYTEDEIKRDYPSWIK